MQSAISIVFTELALCWCEPICDGPLNGLSMTSGHFDELTIGVASNRVFCLNLQGGASNWDDMLVKANKFHMQLK